MEKDYIINGIVLHVCIGDIYLTPCIYKQKFKLFFWRNPCVDDYSYQHEIDFVSAGGQWIGTGWRNQSEWGGGIVRNTQFTSDLVPVQSFHSLIPIANTGVSIAPYHEHHRNEVSFRIEIIDDSNEIYGPNGKQRVLESSAAEYIDTYV
jgi:hypothetical protein